jgi:hypothetical protein
VFAVLCVLLTALGHVLTSGRPVAWPVLAAALAGTGGVAWLLARRERGPAVLIPATLGVQGLLHVAFALARLPAGPPGGRLLADALLCGAPREGSAAAAAALAARAGLGDLAAGGAGHGPGHGLFHGAGHGPVVAMVAAHTLVGLGSAVWLWCGERAVARLLRAAAARVLGPVLGVLGPVPRPARRTPGVRAAGRVRAPHRWLLARAVPTRGPPAGPAAA